ncbi:hypothetical protein AB0I52_09315 [Streptomyces sp. NPDC050423]
MKTTAKAPVTLDPKKVAAIQAKGSPGSLAPARWLPPRTPTTTE